jgi:hypothetical protein
LKPIIKIKAPRIIETIETAIHFFFLLKMVNTFNCFGEADLEKTFQCLDKARLTKQLVETVQLVETIEKVKQEACKKTAFGNHPVVRMWFDHESALIDYGLRCAAVIAERFSDYKRHNMVEKLLNNPLCQKGPMYPPWFNDPKLYMSHRASLFFKSPDLYPQFEEEAKMYDQYAWPVKVAKPSKFFETIMNEFHKKMWEYEMKPWKPTMRRPEPNGVRANYLLKVQGIIVGKGTKVPSYDEYRNKKLKRIKK